MQPDSLILPPRAEIEIFEGPKNPGRKCDIKIPSEIGPAVLDGRRIIVTEQGNSNG